MPKLPVPSATLIPVALGLIGFVIVVLGVRWLWRRARRPQWDYCTIQWFSPEPMKGEFFADVTDAKRQPARISSRMLTLATLQPDKHNPDHVRALNGIINGLEVNGWQLLDEPGQNWYSQRFRRPTR